MKPVEVVAKAIYDATVAKARRERAHVAKWADLPAYWREVHLNAARAAIDAMVGLEVPEPLRVDAQPLDPTPCGCECHIWPGVKHVIACCSAPPALERTGAQP